MLKKGSLIFFSLLILGVLLLTSCFLKPPVTEGILKGQVMVPEGSVEAKDLVGQALPDATVNIIDLSTGDIIATTTTDANGYYQVFVPAGGPYLLQAVKDGVKVQQITPQVEAGIEYDLGIADCATTSVALIVQAMMAAEDFPNNPADINLSDIEADSDFNDVMNIVCTTIESGEDPTVSAAIQQAVEDFLYPPEPIPTPTLTYTVTYDGNGSTGGTVPVDPSSPYEYGATVTVLGKGGLVKNSYTFAGWNTEAGGGGTDQAAGSTFNMGTANVTLHAQWKLSSANQEFLDNQEMITHHLEEIAELGKTPEEYAQELAALLINENQVSKAETLGNIVHITFTSGKVHVIRFDDKDIEDDDYLLGGSAFPTTPAQKDLHIEGRDILLSRSYFPQREASSTIPLEEQTITVQDFTKAYQPRSTSTLEKLVYNRNILIWSPESYWAGLQKVYLLDALLLGDNLGFTIDMIHGSSATINSLKEITNYGMIFILAHGDVYGMKTGEKCTEDKHEQYKNDFKIYSWDGVKLIDNFPYFEIGETYFGILSDWISENVPKVENNKIVIGNMCYNGSELWWDAFSEIGAGDYFGWDGKVNILGAIIKSGILMKSLKSGVSNTEDVYEPYSCPIFQGNWLRFGYPVRFASEEINHPPVITSTPVTSATKDEPYSYDVNATDPDGDIPVYSLTTNPNGMTINSSTGLITWTPTATGSFGVTVKASDGELFDAQSFTVTVEENGTFLGQVQLISPSNGATLAPGDITFSWNPVSNATKYQFILYSSLGQIALDATDSGTSSIVGLDIEETITWKIRAGDNSGNWGAWSSIWSLTIKSTTSYSLRDIGPAGGWIFYDKGYYSSGWRYLEAAPASIEWTEIQYGWGSYGTFIGGTETGIGSGQSNTTKIVTWLNSHSETDRAAQLCDALVYGGCNDWFLPSKDELNLMYENLKVNGVGGFADDAYWSSSEHSTYCAWTQSFYSGYQYGYYGKYYFDLRGRAVRAF